MPFPLTACVDFLQSNSAATNDDRENAKYLWPWHARIQDHIDRILDFRFHSASFACTALTLHTSTGSELYNESDSPGVLRIKVFALSTSGLRLTGHILHIRRFASRVLHFSLAPTDFVLSL